MPVRVFCRNEPNLTDISCRPEDVAEQMVKYFLQKINGVGTPDWTLNVKPMEVKDSAQMHCDKWVEEAGMHFALYASARQPTDVPALNAPASVTEPKYLRKYKVYSGDVSGVIGESLFSILLIKHFGLQDDGFAHLRADRSSGIYPDFAIYQPTTQLLARLDWQTGVTHTRPIPAEVKTANYPEKGAMKPQLVKAISQIRNYWSRLASSPEPSIVCVAVRNPNNQSYDLAVVWGA